MAWEAGVATDPSPELDLRALVLWLEPGAAAQEETPLYAEESEAPPAQEAAEHQSGEHTGSNRSLDQRSRWGARRRPWRSHPKQEFSR